MLIGSWNPRQIASRDIELFQRCLDESICRAASHLQYNSRDSWDVILLQEPGSINSKHSHNCILNRTVSNFGAAVLMRPWLAKYVVDRHIADNWVGVVVRTSSSCYAFLSVHMTPSRKRGDHLLEYEGMVADVLDHARRWSAAHPALRYVLGCDANTEPLHSDAHGARQVGDQCEGHRCTEKGISLAGLLSELRVMCVNTYTDNLPADAPQYAWTFENTYKNKRLIDVIGMPCDSKCYMDYSANLRNDHVLM
jgi:hypothetical protein